MIALALLGATTRPASVEQFEQALASHDSATEALRQWCAARGFADEPAIRAELIGEPRQRPSASLRRILRIGAGETMGYRHVRLSCGDKVLSEAHNWYAASRLTPEMNHRLDHSDAPFGQVAAQLGYKRERLGGKRGAAYYCPAGTILSHRALLRLPDGTPLAYVVECYTSANLDPR